MAKIKARGVMSEMQGGRMSVAVDWTENMASTPEVCIQGEEPWLMDFLKLGVNISSSSLNGDKNGNKIELQSSKNNTEISKIKND